MSLVNAYCVDEVTILKYMGNDTWGEPLSGEVITIKGYVEWKTRLVTGPRGEEAKMAKASALSPVTVYLPKRKVVLALERGLLMEDRIILDQGGTEEYYSGMPDEALSRAIVEIRQPKDFSSPHYEVYLA